MAVSPALTPRHGRGRTQAGRGGQSAAGDRRRASRGARLATRARPGAAARGSRRRPRPAVRVARAGARADALRARRRRRPERVRADLSRRSADRHPDPPPALAAAQAPPLAVGGARMGDHRAADRGPPRGRDPAPGGVPLGGAAGTVRGERLAWPRPAAQRAFAGDDRGTCARRARRDRPGAQARGGDGEGRPRGGRRAGSIATARPTTAACSRSPTSGPGRSRSSATRGAATPTRCRPATWPT